jgi:hypothetical protein
MTVTTVRAVRRPPARATAAATTRASDAGANCSRQGQAWLMTVRSSSVSRFEGTACGAA